MREIDWPSPQKRKGKALVHLHVKVEAAFVAALRTRAENETLRLGRKVSQGTVLQTLALQSDERLRAHYQNANEMQ